MAESETAMGREAAMGAEAAAVDRKSAEMAAMTSTKVAPAEVEAAVTTATVTTATMTTAVSATARRRIGGERQAAESDGGRQRQRDFA
jgi:hypothetical protein